MKGKQLRNRKVLEGHRVFVGNIYKRISLSSVRRLLHYNTQISLTRMRKFMCIFYSKCLFIVNTPHSSTLNSRPSFKKSTLRGEAGYNFTVSYASDFPSEISSISKHQA